MCFLRNLKQLHKKFNLDPLCPPSSTISANPVSIFSDIDHVCQFFDQNQFKAWMRIKGPPCQFFWNFNCRLVVLWTGFFHPPAHSLSKKVFCICLFNIYLNLLIYWYLNFFKSAASIAFQQCCSLGSVRFASGVVGCLGHACDAER